MLVAVSPMCNLPSHGLQLNYRTFFTLQFFPLEPLELWAPGLACLFFWQVELFVY